jgi:hypothetical protein
MNDDNKCFYEEIGFGVDGKLWETGCDNEHSADQLSELCSFCNKPIEVAPGCRRCSSTEHTTGWHDENESGVAKPAVEIRALNGADFKRLITGDKS